MPISLNSPLNSPLPAQLQRVLGVTASAWGLRTPLRQATWPRFFISY